MLTLILQFGLGVLAAFGFAAPPAAWPPQDPRGLARAVDPVPNSDGNAGLFFGVNDFDDPALRDLKFAVNDAIALAHVFVLETRLIPAKRAALVISGAPTKEDSRAQLAALRAAGVQISEQATEREFFSALTRVLAGVSSETSLVVLTLSSHGFQPESVPFIMPSDAQMNRLGGSAIAVPEVEGQLSGCGARNRLLVLDACREKPVDRGEKSTVGATPAALNAVLLAKLAVPRGQVVIASCAPDEYSYEDADVQHGAFTHALIEGLRGKADPDDFGLITVGCLKAYVQKHFEARPDRAQRRQNPSFDGPIGTEYIPLAINPRRSEEMRDRLRKLMEMLERKQITAEEYTQARDLMDSTYLDATARAQLDVYLKIASGAIRDVADARRLLAAIKAEAAGTQPAAGASPGAPDPQPGGAAAAPPSAPPSHTPPPKEPPAIGSDAGAAPAKGPAEAPPRFAAWVGRLMPMHCERPEGGRVRGSTKELRITSLSNGQVKGDLCERGRPVAAVTGSYTPNSMTLEFSACQTRGAAWPAFQMEIKPVDAPAGGVFWSEPLHGDRVHRARLTDRTMTLVELAPPATLILLDRGGGSTGEYIAEPIRGGMLAVYGLEITSRGREYKVGDLCQNADLRLTGTVVLPDELAKNPRVRADATVDVMLKLDGKEVVWRGALSVARPQIALDVPIPRGTQTMFADAQGRGMSGSTGWLGLTLRSK